MASDKYSIAGKYAGALLTLTEQDNISLKIKEELALVQNLFSDNMDIYDALMHPVIDKKEKKEIIQDLFTKYLTPLTINFLLVIIEKGRLSFIEEIIEKYTDLMNKKHNIVIATITTPLKMNPKQVQKLKDKLTTLLNKKIELIEEVNEELIAGAILSIDDKIVDNSLFSKYERLKNQLC